MSASAVENRLLSSFCRIYSSMPPSEVQRTPSVLRKAASIILIRPTKADSYQILMVERMARDGSQFLNAHVFPGGQAEASDQGIIQRTALRELYEEASIHLQPASLPRRVILKAVNVNTIETPFSRYLQESREQLAEHKLIPYSRWITPKSMPKRFDTMFFFALAMPSDNPVGGKVDAKEIQSLAWMTPSEALSQFSQGKITLFPPQWYILSDLNRSMPKFSDLLNFLPQNIQPYFVQTLRGSKSEFTMILPGDECYEPDHGEEAAKSGARHRIIVTHENGRPRQMTLERTASDTKSKL